jgi:acyl-CoA synthetase (AMP-forming)/AMP-acid ligase II/acyl carrier protein
LNPSLTESELSFYLEDLGVRAVIVEEEDTTHCSWAAAKAGIATFKLHADPSGAAGAFTLSTGSVHSTDGGDAAEPNDPALYLHTSGTTSRPKMVPLTHANLCRSAANVAATLRLSPEDVCMNVMPLFHIHGLIAALLASLSAGAQVVCTSGFVAPRFFESLEHVQPTWYTAVPTMHQAILSRAGTAEKNLVRNSRLRLIRSSSASLAPSVLAGLEESFGVPVIEAYGMTEAAHQMTSNLLPPGDRKPGSVGRAAGPEVAVADEDGRLLGVGVIGEVIIRGPNVTRGYHGMEDASGVFHEGGWFRTGDQGYLDDDGYLFLTGRLKEIINRGGETIAPREIDEALLDHPDIRQAIAFSVPDESLGEEVAAAVVVEAGRKVDEASLQTFLSDRLSFAKLPKRLVFLDEIPKGPTGKLQRIGLAKRLGIESVRHKSTGTVDEPGAHESATAEKVSELWCTILQRESIGLDEDFLDVGGDSITATQLVVRIREMLDLDVPLMALFSAATIRKQSILLDELMGRRPQEETN